MKIGIDISQIIYEGTGVAQYTKQLVSHLLEKDTKNEYILFYSHFRKELGNWEIGKFNNPSVIIKQYRIPLPILEFLWNRLHILPIEWLIGEVDVFFTSDWLEPPTKKAKKVTTLHDLSILTHPETFDQKIISVHKRKLHWVKKESTMIMCDSQSTRKDAVLLLGIPKERLVVVYPGIR